MDCDITLSRQREIIHPSEHSHCDRCNRHVQHVQLNTFRFDSMMYKCVECDHIVCHRCWGGGDACVDCCVFRCDNCDCLYPRLNTCRYCGNAVCNDCMETENLCEVCYWGDFLAELDAYGRQYDIVDMYRGEIYSYAKEIGGAEVGGASSVLGVIRDFFFDMDIDPEVSQLSMVTKKRGIPENPDAKVGQVIWL